MSIYVGAVTPNLKFYRGLKKMENQLALNAEQRRLKRSSLFSDSHPGEDLSLLLQEQVVPPVDIKTAVVADSTRSFEKIRIFSELVTEQKGFKGSRIQGVK